MSITVPDKFIVVTSFGGMLRGYTKSGKLLTIFKASELGYSSFRTWTTSKGAHRFIAAEKAAGADTELAVIKVA